MIYRFLKLKKAIKRSWGIDTAYKDDVPKWSADNPAVGQCAVTALIIHEYFGGQIYSGESQDGVVHYWNKVHGFKIDLTRSQFKETKIFSNIIIWKPEDLLQTGNVRERYEILRSRIEMYLHK
ncbi:MAG: hypothetical protein K0M69_05465 [Youngiibacter sp.]|jgi:hypothetical protein|nr:hypothetical protein [Youngiibacter sp.]